MWRNFQWRIAESWRTHRISTRFILPSELPLAVLALCDGGSDGKLAEPGQNWNATDSITDRTLPGKRLIWAAAGDDYYVVHYERGGIAHTYHILVAKIGNDKGKPKLIWRAIGGPFKDYAALLDALGVGSWIIV
jgi:hypothetical protein